MHLPCRQFNCILWVISCLLIANTLTQPLSEKNTTNGGNKSEEKQLKGSESIINPTNIFKNNDGTLINELNRNSATDGTGRRNLRPFEWLYKHLGEYLMCAYSERNDCEQQLAKNMRQEETSTGTAERSYTSPNKQPTPLRYPMSSFPYGRPMERFQSYPNSYHDRPSPREFMNHAGMWDHQPRRNGQFDHHQNEFDHPNGPPRLLQFPSRQDEGPHGPEHHDRPEHPDFNQQPMMMFPPDFMPFTGVPRTSEEKPELLRNNERKKNDENIGARAMKVPQQEGSYSPMMEYPMMGFPIFPPYP